MIRTYIILVSVTVGLTLTLAGQVPAVEVLLDDAAHWLASITSIARCPSAPDSGWCS